jgi:hypothetical protein
MPLIKTNQKLNHDPIARAHRGRIRELSITPFLVNVERDGEIDDETSEYARLSDSVLDVLTYQGFPRRLNLYKHFLVF